MNIKEALQKLREAFRAAPLGFIWHGSDEYCKLFDMGPSEALAIAEEAVRGMQSKRSLDDATYFALGNELAEKIFVYNLLLRAIEQDGEVSITDRDIAQFKAKTANCVLMDYGMHIAKLLGLLTKGEKEQLPEGVQGFSF